MKRVKELSLVERPREVLMTKGAALMTDTDLTAVMLGNGIKGYDVRRVAHGLVSKFGSRLLDVDFLDLSQVKGIGRSKALGIIAARELFLRLHKDRVEPVGVEVSSPARVAQILIDISSARKEHLKCLYLDVRKKLIACRLISVGTLDSNLFHPREIFEEAIKVGASAIIVGHNHPSGNTEPSREDVSVSKQLVQAGKVLGINCLDHVIVSKNKWQSVMTGSVGQTFA